MAASRPGAIIAQHLGSRGRTKSLPPRCVYLCVCVHSRGSEPPVLHCMLSRWNIWTDRSFVPTVGAIFDMVWYRGANKHKSSARHRQCPTVTHLSRRKRRRRQGRPVCVFQRNLGSREPDTFSCQHQQNVCMETCRGFARRSFKCAETLLNSSDFSDYQTLHFGLRDKSPSNLDFDAPEWGSNLQYPDITSRCLSFSSEVSFIFCSSVCVCVCVCSQFSRILSVFQRSQKHLTHIRMREDPFPAL